jgi:predicted GNAT family acetyltransferase
MEPTVTYRLDLEGVDWAVLKRLVAADDFDNGRTPEQLARSFANSAVTCIAYDGAEIIGTARALSDGVCNAYIVDVWTRSSHRGQGVARGMLQRVLEQLPGQHVYLFTDTAEGLYVKLGFQRQGIGMGRVVGQWLQNEPTD